MSLHNMEHFQFAGHVIAMCEESAIEKIKAVLEPLKTAVAEEDKALNLPRKQEGTADLEELDRVRDQAYRALQLLIEMHSCSDDMTKRKSAQPSGVFDVKALRAATDKALNAVIRRMDSLDDLEPETPKLPELIKQYNALVDKYRLTLAHRAGTSQTARNKRTAEYEARLKPGFAALEQLLKLEKGSLSFTGKTEGTGAKRHYELAIKGQTAPDGKPKTIWVGVNKDGSLFIYEKKSAKPGAAGTTEKPEYEIKPKAEA